MARSITPGEVEALLAMKPAPVLLDVRREAAYEAAQDQIAGASWRDPSSVGSWASALSQNAPIVVYCVHGHAVSQSVAAELGQLGYDARYLEGGIESWREAGGVLATRILDETD